VTETDTPLATTPLDALHRRLGARMVAFAGYEMPLQYPDGILKEHQHCRARAGLFDVSHMGQIRLWPRGGELATAARALERLVPADILGLREGRQRYALFTEGRGGILDDLMVANRGDHLFLVVNAACKAADRAHLETLVADACRVEMVADRALLALQGPEAEAVLAGLAPEVAEMRFMDAAAVTLSGADCVVSRSGYTGEDGFEISAPAEAAEALAEALLAHDAVAPIGLGARDSLRLEAGLCLYGQDIDRTTTPVEAGLDWSIGRARRPGAEREGGFPGAARIFSELGAGPARRRVGLRVEGRAPIRAGAGLYDAPQAETPVGQVTSGVFGPTVGAPVAMGYVPTAHAEPGSTVWAELRGRRLAAEVAPLPFVPARQKR
jgi:aminomethyltransferase